VSLNKRLSAEKTHAGQRVTKRAASEATPPSAEPELMGDLDEAAGNLGSVGP
jgi:hypothetical protein